MYPTTRRNFTDEFKVQTVAMAETLGRTEAARLLDLPIPLLSRKELRERAECSVPTPFPRA